jgi:hypothetical protein
LKTGLLLTLFLLRIPTKEKLEIVKVRGEAAQILGAGCRRRRRQRQAPRLGGRAPKEPDKKYRLELNFVKEKFFILFVCRNSRNFCFLFYLANFS